MIEEFVYFTKSFEPTDEFKTFCDNLGYNTIFSRKLNNFVDLEVEKFVFDNRIVNFVKNHINYQDKAMKGNISNRYKIGYAGIAYIISVDTSKKWIIAYNSSTPNIKYITTQSTNKGYTYIS